MCRFLAYKGPQISMADLLTRSDQSLIRQSFEARERQEPLNGDGFGVGWYADETDPTPCVFTSVQPAWANRNLRRLAEKIQATCFFAHVRAASPGTPVSEFNCHPFQCGKFLWMHNGKIADFKKIRRRLRAHLDDDSYDVIQGTTDSEHVFALFLNQLRDHGSDYDLDSMRQALRSTVKMIEHWLQEEDISEHSHLNFCLTDRDSILAMRYVTESDAQPQTLYMAHGERFELRDDHYRMIPGHGEVGAVIIASEPLTSDRNDWESIPTNHFVSVSPELHIDLQPV